MNADTKAAQHEILVCSVRRGQLWRHVKSDGLYKIVRVGLDEATREVVVVYEGKTGIAWLRKLVVFLENTSTGPRFARTTRIREWVRYLRRFCARLTIH